MQRAASTASVAARGVPYKVPFQLGARPISISTPSAPCPCSMLSTAPSPPSTAPPLSECSSIAECGAMLSNAPSCPEHIIVHDCRRRKRLGQPGEPLLGRGRPDRGRRQHGSREPQHRARCALTLSPQSAVAARRRQRTSLAASGPRPRRPTSRPAALHDGGAPADPRPEAPSAARLVRAAARAVSSQPARSSGSRAAPPVQAELRSASTKCRRAISPSPSQTSRRDANQ